MSHLSEERAGPSLLRRRHPPTTRPTPRPAPSAAEAAAASARGPGRGRARRAHARARRGLRREVWARLQPRLDAERRWLRRAAPAAALGARGALAASLVVAFLAGRHFPRRPRRRRRRSRRQRASASCCVAVGDHLERSQVLLVELANAGRRAPRGRARGPGVGGERWWARTGCIAQSAVRPGEHRGGEPCSRSWSACWSRSRTGPARRLGRGAGAHPEAASSRAGSCSRSASSSPRSASGASRWARRALDVVLRGELMSTRWMLAVAAAGGRPERPPSGRRPGGGGPRRGSTAPTPSERGRAQEEAEERERGRAYERGTRRHRRGAVGPGGPRTSSASPPWAASAPTPPSTGRPTR